MKKYYVYKNEELVYISDNRRYAESYANKLKRVNPEAEVAIQEVQN